MFDFGIGYTEIFVVALVAILVIGPKDLPHVLRAVGKTVGKMRSMAREFQGHLDTAMREAGLDDVKREMQGLKSLANVDLDPTLAKGAAPRPAAVSADATAFKTYFGDAAASLPEAAPKAGEGAA